jgi:hypothetical protein
LTKDVRKVIIIQIGDSTASEGGCHFCSSTGLGISILRIKFNKLLFLMGMDDEKLKKKIQRAVP